MSQKASSTAPLSPSRCDEKFIDQLFATVCKIIGSNLNIPPVFANLMTFNKYRINIYRMPIISIALIQISSITVAQFIEKK